MTMIAQGGGRGSGGRLHKAHAHLPLQCAGVSQASTNASVPYEEDTEATGTGAGNGIPPPNWQPVRSPRLGRARAVDAHTAARTRCIDTQDGQPSGCEPGDRGDRRRLFLRALCSG